jgi:microcystin-dependent protein
MQASGIPPKFPLVWAINAAAAYLRAIPATTADPTAASLSLGFPPANATPIGAGGTPPNAKDENGILKQITQWSQWQQAGAAVYYDSVFSAAIGGYPAGAVLSNASTLGSFWMSLVDNNMSDPDTGGANWAGYSLTSQTIVPVGSIIYFPSTTPPSGWLESDAAAISRTTYANLNAIAAAASYAAPWGVGDGSTTFNIPDLRGVLLRGYDDGRGLTSDAFGTYYADEFAAHYHLGGAPSGDGTPFVYGSTTADLPGSAANRLQRQSSSPSAQGLTSTVGGAETAPKRVSLLPCIKY